MDDPDKTLAYDEELRLSGIPTVIGNYQVIAPLGHGGMGEVVKVKLRLGKEEAEKKKSARISIQVLREEAAKAGVTIDEEGAAKLSQGLEQRLTETIIRPDVNLDKIKETVSYTIKGIDPDDQKQVDKISARDLEQKVFAMKLIPSNAKSQIVTRFQHEHETLTTLRRKDKPNIVKIIEAGEEQGWQYYVMELLPREIPDEKISEANAIKVIKAVSQGLTLPHSLGIVHRDIKPANVRLRVSKNLDEVDIEDIVITDFGIAKNYGQTDVTIGEIIGTVAYISPERAAGETLSDDELKQSDIYALGAMLYQFLTGELPSYGIGHDADPKAFLGNVAGENDLDLLPRDIVKIDQRLEAIVLKMMAKDRTRRYKKVNEVIEELVRYEDVKHYENLLLELAKHRSEKISVKELIDQGLDITIDNEFYELNINEAIKKLKNKVKELTPKAVEYSTQYLKERHLRKTAKRRFWTRLGTTAALTLAIVAGGTFLLTHKSPADKRYESIAAMYDNAVEKEKQQNIDSLLAAERLFDQTVMTLEQDLREFSNDPRTPDFKRKYEEAKSKSFEIDGEILRKAIEELRNTDATSTKSDELQTLILNKLCEYKVRHLVDVLPVNEIPTVVDEDGIYRFGDKSKDADLGNYPAMLRVAYEVTGDQIFLQKFRELTEIVRQRPVINESSEEFRSYFETIYYLYKTEQKPEQKQQLITIAKELLKRFRGENNYLEGIERSEIGFGNFFRAMGFLDEQKGTKEQLQPQVGCNAEILPALFIETGDLIFWDAYAKHMETALNNLLKEDGSVWSIIGFAQKNMFVKPLERQVNEGERYYQSGYKDWKDQTSIFTRAQATAIASFARHYGLTNNPRFLEAARKIADFVISKKEQNNTWRWNLAQGNYDIDTNCSVMIADALLDLSLYETDQEKSRMYRQQAQQTLSSLTTNYLQNDLEFQGLLTPVYGSHEEKLIKGSTFADFMFLRALQKLQHQEKFNQRRLLLRKDQQYSTSGFIREATGALAIEDRTILSMSYNDNDLLLDLKCFYNSSSQNEEIRLLIDLPYDQDTYFVFAFSPNELKQTIRGLKDVSWRPEWQLTTETTSEYWTAKVRIPLNTFTGFNASQQFDFNIYRSSANGYSSLGFIERHPANFGRFGREDQFRVVNVKINLEE